MRRWLWIAGIMIGLLIFLTVVTWPGVPLALASITAEQAPAPLGDQPKWGEPSPEFAKRFAPGTSEQSLIDWLRANRFETTAKGHAEREIRGFPCLERAEVDWSANAGGTLTSAVGRVYEAGCL